jgi:hypothetical protein
MRSPCCPRVRVPINVARQRLGKQVPAATITYATTEELLDAVLRGPCRIKYSICSERKVGD